jgi:hypothetical protein
MAREIVGDRAGKQLVPAGKLRSLALYILNNRYQDTAAQCADGLALYHCNGVLIRVTDSLIASQTHT